MREYVVEKSGRSKCDVLWGVGCSDMELKYVDKWIGPNADRKKDVIMAEKQKWDKEMTSGQIKNFAQVKQRLMMLEKILSNFNNPEL